VNISRIFQKYRKNIIICSESVIISGMIVSVFALIQLLVLVEDIQPHMFIIPALVAVSFGIGFAKLKIARIAEKTALEELANLRIEQVKARINQQIKEERCSCLLFLIVLTR